MSVGSSVMVTVLVGLALLAFAVASSSALFLWISKGGRRDAMAWGVSTFICSTGAAILAVVLNAPRPVALVGLLAALTPPTLIVVYRGWEQPSTCHEE